MQAKAWDMFVNVDGQYGRTLCPLPHAQLDNAVVDRKTVEKWDQLSCHDRFEQIKHKLTSEEQGLLVSLLLHISGGNMKNSSLWDMVRSHALLMHSSDNFSDVWLRYKLRDGQTALVKRIFEEAKEGGMEHSFSTPVQSIVQGKSGGAPVTISTVNGETFRARRVVSTIPLNVLKDIRFSPPLSRVRQEAISIGHVNHMTKIHADVSNPELERWNGMRFPGELMYGYGDGLMPNGNVHLVAFGADQRQTFVPEKNPEMAAEALRKLHPMDIKRLVMLNSLYSSPSRPCKTDLHARSSTTGVRILSPKGAQLGGSRVTCPSTKTSSRAATATYFLPLLIGHTDGGLLLTAL